MNAECRTLVERVINRMANEGAWLNEAAKDAFTWGQTKDRTLGRDEVATMASAVYAAKGLDTRGRKATTAS